MTGNYLMSSAFMLIVLLIFAKKTCSDIHQPQSRHLCLCLIGMVAAYVLMDAAFIINFISPFHLPGYRAVVFVFYVIYVVLPFVWHTFVRNFVGCTLGKAIRRLECVPLAAALAMVLFTPFTGVLWSVSDEGVYTRGPWFSDLCRAQSVLLCRVARERTRDLPTAAAEPGAVSTPVGPHLLHPARGHSGQQLHHSGHARPVAAVLSGHRDGACVLLHCRAREQEHPVAVPAKPSACASAGTHRHPTGRNRQQGQIRFSGEYVARHPHAAQRHSRLLAYHCRRPDERRRGRKCGWQDTGVGQHPAQSHQRCAWS